MPWSPVAMPVRRERAFIIAATSFSVRLRPLIAHIEAAPAASGALHLAREHRDRGRAQPRIGVQEQQNVAARRRGAGVHLRGTSALRDERAVGERSGKRERRVAAPAVDDDDLVAFGAQRLQRRERRGDAAHLVERGNDDRNAHAAALASAVSGERAAAARALSGRAPVAMVGHGDRRGVDLAGRARSVTWRRGLPATTSGIPSIWLKSQSYR